MKNTKTTLKTIYRCSNTNSILLTINDQIIQHKRFDTIKIKTASSYNEYEIVEDLDMFIDASVSQFDISVIKEYIIFEK